MRPSIWLSFFAFRRCCAPAIPRVPRAGNCRPRQPSSPWQALRFTRGLSCACASFQRRFSSLTRLRYARFPCPCKHHRLTWQSRGTPKMPPFSEQAPSRGAPYFYVRPHWPLFLAYAQGNRKPHGSVAQALPPTMAASHRFPSHQPRCLATAGREGDSRAFCPACAQVSDFLSSLSTAVVFRPFLASRVQEIAAAVSRLLPGGPCVSLLGTPAPALRFSAASHHLPVCGMLAFHAHANTIA